MVLDGSAPVEVDLYAATYDRYKQKVYNTGLLPDGEHTLSIYWKGLKNTYATSSRINVDAFDVLGALADAPRADPILWRYEQSEARYAVLGNWTSLIDAYASGGSLLTTNQKDAALVAKFDGTAFKLIAKAGTGYGLAEVVIDGGTPIEVDLWNATTVNKKVFNLPEFSGLALGEHTVVIKCKGAASAGHTATAIDIDALDITGWLVPAPAATRVEETPSGSVVYDGTWTPATEASASGGSLTSASTAGAKVTVSFTGTNFTWLAKANKYMGKAKVTLDPGTPGEVVTSVDLYSYYTTYKKVVYKTPLLENTSHTVVIEWTGAKNSASLGTAVCVDAFDVLGSL